MILIIATLLLESFSAGTKKGQIKIIDIFWEGHKIWRNHPLGSGKI